VSVIRRLYNVAKGKAIVSRSTSEADPSLADEPLRPRAPFADDDEAAEAEPDSEEDVPTVEDTSRGPRPRRLSR
jgi:hypothetical protein